MHRPDKQSRAQRVQTFALRLGVSVCIGSNCIGLICGNSETVHHVVLTLDGSCIDGFAISYHVYTQNKDAATGLRSHVTHNLQKKKPFKLRIDVDGK